MKNILFASILLFPLFCLGQQKDFTEVDFQFLQNNKPISTAGLTFRFRLLDSTNRVVATFDDKQEIIRLNDYKIKVRVLDSEVAHLQAGNYTYELVDVKENKERLWQKGIFKITNNVGATTSIIAQNDRSEGLIDLLRKEVDPTVGAHIKSITKEQITLWDSISKQKQAVYIPPVAVNSVIYQSDYAKNDSGIAVLNGTATIQRQNGQLNITNINGAVIGVGNPDRYRDGQLLHVYIDFVKTSSDVLVSARFGNAYGYLLNKTGKYYFTISRKGTYPLYDFNVLTLQPVAGGGNSLIINELNVHDGGAGFDVNTPYVKIGNGAKGDFNSVIIGKDANYAGNFRDGVVIGTNAKTDQQGSVVIGAEANGNYDNTYGCASGNDQTVVGYAGRGYGWRTTAVGAWSAAGGQSSTVLGAGAVALTSHSVAIGRGAFAANVPNLSGIFTTDVRKIYFGNSYAHRFPKHPINDTDYSVDTIEPTTTEIEIHGQDALDARETPSDFNKAGGHLGLYGGRGTGTGNGGEIRFYTAPIQANTGRNDKNPAIPAAKFDSSNTPTDGTRFLLYDTQSGTMKRVKLAPADAQGRKMLYVEN